MTYRFYITIGSSVTEVFPLGFLDTLLIDTQEKSQAFYRRTFSGPLTFTNNNGADDFDLFYSAEIADPCGKILFLIEREDVYYWDGYFSTTDGRFDLDNCTFEVTPLPDDDYVLLMDEQKIQYNMINISDIDAPVITTNIYGTATTYTRNRFLIDVIAYLADQMLPGVTLSSDFFTEAINPATLNTNHLLYLTIAQKSDIIRPASSDPATTAMISWQELMEIVWVMFQVQWDYDSVTDTINVEHISWWTKDAGLDLRTQLLTQSTNKYSYSKDQMPKYEIFSFAEADDDNFVGTPIRYESKCVNPDPDSNRVSQSINVTTDLEYIIDNPDAIADEGFVILCNYLDGGNYYVESDYTPYIPSYKLNNHLSVANLQHRYYRHNRVLINGYMNEIPTTFWTAQKTKIQECYAIICPSDNYDPGDEITTELGETYLGGVKGTVKRSELNPNGEMKFTLAYGPEDNENTGVEDINVITLTETTGVLQSIFAISLNNPADADLTFDMVLTCRDAGDVECDTAPQTFTILTGARYGSKTINWCTPAGAPICVAAKTFDSYPAGAPGWQVVLNSDPDSECP